MEKLLKLALAFMVFAGLSVEGFSQCETWIDNPRQSDAENAHVIYRGIVKGKQPADLAKMDQENFNMAFNNWKTAYEIAPAADGQRPFHYMDGRKLYKAMMEKETDEAKKKEYMEKVLELYDQQIECFPKMSTALYGRKAFDMFYSPFYGYRQATADAFAVAVEKAGDKSEYIVFEPYGQLVVYMYQNDKMDQLKARAINLELNEIADKQIEAGGQYKAYYESAKARMNNHFKAIEDEIFDCEYFRNKLMPDVEANPEDLEILKYAYVKLSQQGCDDTADFMVELKEKYEAKAAEVNAALEAEFLAKNPGVAAKRAYDDGDFKEAINLYEKAIEKAEEEGDTDKQAEYYFGIASIQYRKLDNYRGAREYARKAASLREGWGRPYMLIGDMYAASSRSCGNDGYTRGLAVIAAIDKYAYAKSIDPEVAEEANKKIGLYSASMPTQDDVFMRGKQGATERVPCWIGEMVKVRYN
jgi:tetratricopeptide (TPR) repeat protein